MILPLPGAHGLFKTGTQSKAPIPLARAAR